MRYQCCQRTFAASNSIVDVTIGCNLYSMGRCLSIHGPHNWQGWAGKRACSGTPRCFGRGSFPTSHKRAGRLQRMHTLCWNATGSVIYIISRRSQPLFANLNILHFCGVLRIGDPEKSLAKFTVRRHRVFRVFHLTPHSILGS